MFAMRSDYVNILIRLFLSAVIGGLFLIFLILIFVLLGTVFGYPTRFEWLVKLPLELIFFPLPVFEFIFPRPLGCESCGPSNKALAATLLFDVFIYSIPIHALLWRRPKRKPLP